MTGRPQLEELDLILAGMVDEGFMEMDASGDEPRFRITDKGRDQEAFEEALGRLSCRCGRGLA